MSYYDDAKKLIEARFDANWLAADGPVQYDNQRFRTPSTQWVKIFIVPTEAPTMSLGPVNKYRHSGMISVSVFTPEGTGGGPAWELAEKVQIIFRGQTFSGVVCHGSHIERIGRTEDGWYQLIVDTEFYFDGTN